VTAIVLALWIEWSPPGANDITASEGYYGTQARGLLLDHRFPLSPPLRPMGEPGFKPPLYPALLAVSVHFLGANEVALRWPSLAMAALIAVSLAVLVARAAGGFAGAGTAALLMSLPWYADSSRFAASVIPVTALGIAALVVLARAPGTIARAAGAGALLGLAYLCKLWLMVPLLCAALAMIGRRPAHAMALLGATLAVGSAHLIAVAAFEPALLSGWFLFGWRVFLWDWLTGARYAGGLVHPPGFYLWILTHAFVLLLPLIGLGALTALRRWREPVPRGLLVWALGAAGLSLSAVKLPIYLYVVIPPWVGLASLGAAALASGRQPPGVTAWLGLALLAVVGSPFAARAAGAEGPAWQAWTVAWAGFLAAVLVGRRGSGARSIAPRLAALALVLLAIGGGLAREARRLPLRYHDPGLRRVAQAVAPRLADVPPGRVSVLSVDAPAVSYYLFRTARHWFLEEGDTPERRLARVASDDSLRVFVIDRDAGLYGGAPDPALLAWLESATREITGEIEAGAGRRLGVRVFVRQPGTRAVPGSGRLPGDAGSRRQGRLDAVPAGDQPGRARFAGAERLLEPLGGCAVGRLRRDGELGELVRHGGEAGRAGAGQRRERIAERRIERAPARAPGARDGVVGRPRPLQRGVDRLGEPELGFEIAAGDPYPGIEAHFERP
jgi:4-amino-4-deoxy-L-arabinose transferase-like glycosyltransferase